MENNTRTEILTKFIKSKQEELDTLRKLSANGESVPLGKINDLENEIEEAENELKEIAELEGAYNSGVNLEESQKEYEIEEEIVEETEPVKKEELQDVLERNEREELDEEEKINDGQLRLSFTDWQIRMGIDVLPDELKYKYAKDLTEEDFKKALKKENVPIVVQEEGKTDNYFKDDDINILRTSKSTLEQAVANGSIPVNVDNDEAHIMLEYGKEVVTDYNKNKEEDGYGKIDEEDILRSFDTDNSKEDLEEEKRLEQEANQIDETGELWNEIRAGLKNGMKLAVASEMIEAARNAAQVGAVVGGATVIAKDIIKASTGIKLKDFQKGMSNLNNDLENPNPEEIDQDQEIDEDEPQPGMPRKPIN